MTYNRLRFSAIIASLALAVAVPVAGAHQHHRRTHHARLLPDPVAYMRVLAARYWSVQPCGGNYTVAFGVPNDALTGGDQFAAWATWDGTDPASYTSCEISFATYGGFTDTLSIYDGWLDFCPQFLHEVGHLTGHAHVPDPTNIMYPGSTTIDGPSDREKLPLVCLVQPNGVRWHLTVMGDHDWSEHVGRPDPATIPMDRRPLELVAPN